MRTVTVSTIITSVRKRGGYIANVFPAEESALLEYIDSARSEVYDELSFAFEGFYETETEFVTTSSIKDYSLPSDMGHLIAVDNKISTDDYRKVHRYDMADRNLFTNFPATPAGTLVFQYRLQGDNIRFQPVPSGGETIRITYTPYPTKVSGSAQTIDFHTPAEEELVKLYTLRKVQDADAVSTTATDREIERQMKRVKKMAKIRDQHMPKKPSNVRKRNW